MSEEQFFQQLLSEQRTNYTYSPDKVLAHKFIDELYDLLFAACPDKCATIEILSEKFQNLKNIFEQLLSNIVIEKEAVKEQSRLFFDEIHAIYRLLLYDAQAVLEFDPAAESMEEVLLAYPGFYAIAVYRMAHQLHLQQIKLLPRIFTEHAHSLTGIDIHPGAQIGKSFFIDHGTGIVIGATTTIGNDVKIYQGVTLGALNVSKAYASIKRHPTIEDNVVIYSGATILGGDTVIGSNSIIGGNAWLTYSVPAYSVVYHQSEIKIRDNNPFSEPLNFVI